MTDFWREARDARSAAPTRAGFRIAGTASDDGGFMFVAGELLATDEAVAALPELAGPEFVDVTIPEEGIAQVGLRAFSYSGPVPLVDKVRQLEADARTNAIAAGDDPDACVVDLDHVLTGEPYIYKGGPFDLPQKSDDQWQSAASWGAGSPTAAVLDTGIPIEAPLGLWHNVDADRELDVDLCFPPGENGPYFGAEAGHGAFIVGLMVRFGGGALSLAARKVLDPDGFGTERMVVDGLARLHADQPGVQVINMSLGTYSWHDRMPLGLGRGLAMWPATTLVVAAAGNNGRAGRPYWPAASPEVVAVASVGSDGVSWAPSEFSNSGAWVDVCTDGEGVISLYPFGTVQVASMIGENVQGWAIWSGTSFAAPIVAAEIARRSVVDGVDGRTAWTEMQSGLPSARDLGQQFSGFGLLYDARIVLGIEPTKP